MPRIYLPPTPAEVRAKLRALMAKHRVRVRYLSSAMERPDRWLEHWMRYSEDHLPARERGWLARYFGISERELGGDEPRRTDIRKR